MKTNCTSYLFTNLLIVLLGSVLFLSVGPLLDNQFPVVKPFKVTTLTTDTNSILIKGWAVKRRDCQTIEVQALVTTIDDLVSRAEVEFLDHPSKKFMQRPKGQQNWGPWRIIVPKDSKLVEIEALHHCHIFWNTRTHFTTIKLQD